MLRRLGAIAVLLLGAGLVVPSSAHADGGPQIVSLHQGWFGCVPGGRFHVVDGPRLGAFGTDPSAAPFSDVTYDFELWPAGDRPAASTSTDHRRLGQPGELHSQVPLTQGSTYSWRARLTTTGGTSGWSPTCSFRLDNTIPTPPVVWSPNFPEDTWGPVGRWVRFVFQPGAGARDAVAYAYSWIAVPSQSCAAGDPTCPEPWQGAGSVRADWIGGPAYVTLAPPGDGFWQLHVVARDAAGNQSSEALRPIYVPSSGPTVAVESSCNGTSRLTFTPHEGVRNVVAWEYRIGFGDPAVHRVAAAADGSGGIELPAQPGTAVSARSVGAHGFRSTWWYVDADPRPFVSSSTYPRGGTGGGVGVTGEFDLRGNDLTEYTAFRYAFGTTARQEVPVGPEINTSTVAWTPRRAGPMTLYVSGKTAAGPWSCDTEYSFRVAR